MSGAKQRDMANCPSAVPGAHTEMTYAEDGIDLVITGPAHGAATQIRRLAHAHAHMAAPAGLGLHTGKHSGTGRIGYCPIVHTDGTAVTAVDVPGGARIHLHADGDAVVAVQDIVARRVVALPRGERVIE